MIFSELCSQAVLPFEVDIVERVVMVAKALAKEDEIEDKLLNARTAALLQGVCIEETDACGDHTRKQKWEKSKKKKKMKKKKQGGKGEL
jgi:hypothetical protein